MGFIIWRRWGADRICPNGPDEGTSKTAKLDCESEDKQIRFFSPEGRIRADSRLVFFSCVKTNAVHENDVHLKGLQLFFRLRSHRISPIKSKAAEYFLYLFNRPFSVYFFTRSSWSIVQETIAKNSAFERCTCAAISCCSESDNSCPL